MLMSVFREMIENILDDFMFKHFYSGYHPLFFVSEITVNPRGWWFSLKGPTSYYPNNSWISIWSANLDSWSSIMRNSHLLTHTFAFSYKSLSSLVIAQVPYWCAFSCWDVISYFITGAPRILDTLYTFHQISLFEGSILEVRLVYKPYYYDHTWKDWFFKDRQFEKETRWGVSIGQIKNRVFWQSFWVGYWVYLFYDTPWPWRIRYPKDSSNLSWVRGPFSRFFRLFNPANVYFLWFTCFVLISFYTLSYIMDYAILRVPFSQIIFAMVASWVYFLFSSFLLYFLLARFAKIILNRVKSCRFVLHPLADFLSKGSPLRKKQILLWLQSLWMAYTFVILLFFIYITFPSWGVIVLGLLKCISVLVTKVFLLLRFLILSPVSWLLHWSPYPVLNFYIYSFFATTIMEFIYLAYFVLFFAVYFTFILWPFISQVVVGRLRFYHPWMFDPSVAIKTRLKFGIYLVINSFRGRFKS